MSDGTSYTDVEQRFVRVLDQNKVSDAAFNCAEELYDLEPYPSVKMSPADRQEMHQLLPDLDIDLVKDAEVKARDGACKCGRIMTILDSVAFTLGKSHSAAFLTEVLNGSRGKLVICADELPASFKDKLPKQTIFIKDTTHIPCKNCGTSQAIIVKQLNMLHWWDGVQ